MDVKDPGQEYRRLSDLYSRKTDEELEALAADVESLTDTAQVALKSEIGRRGLNIVQEHRQEPQPEYRRTATIATFKDVQEASLAKGLLESEGIQCWLVDENVAGIYLAQVVDNIKLQVNEDDVEAAAEVLEEAVNHQTESGPGGDLEQSEPSDLVTVGTFSTLGEAEIARGALEAAGIQSYLFDEHGSPWLRSRESVLSLEG